jgi:sulfite reductase beta subunit-like hemoprotein
LNIFSPSLFSATWKKIAIAFSSSGKDTTLVFIHDLGAIPGIKVIDGKEVRGLKVMMGGGVLGSGNGHIVDKASFVPGKRGPDVLRLVLNDYKRNAGKRFC